MRYLYLQCKRVLKVFPFVLLVSAVLLGGLLAVFAGLMRFLDSREETQKFKVGVVGDMDNVYMEYGLSAIKTLDDTRFAIELEVLDGEDTAAQALKQRDIAAYVVFPEDFVHAVRRGEVISIRMVTGAGSGGLVMIFKEEIARAVTDILEESQKGVFGVQYLLEAKGAPGLVYEYINKMNVEYINFVLHRSDLYRVQELGIADSLPLPDYFFCSFAVLLMLLLGLPYAMLFIKKEWAFQRVLARRFSALRQVACEYLAFLGAMLLLLGLIAGGAAALGSRVPALAGLGLYRSGPSLLLHLIPVAAMAAAFDLMLFELSGNIVNGILLHFFASVSLCYAAGCFYPIYSFPAAVQMMAPFLPTGLARSFLAAGITGEGAWLSFGGILLFTLLFFSGAAGARKRKITARAGG